MRLSVFLLALLAATGFGQNAAAQSQQSSYGFLSLNVRSDRQNAFLSWETIQELTITKFNIQQSRNGVDYKTVGTISASHDTTEIHHAYEFTDLNAGNRGPELYYRLEIAVNNGRMLYSKVFSIKFRDIDEPRLSIQPSAVSSTLPVYIESGISGPAQLQVVDLQGRVLMTRAINLPKGVCNERVDISNLPQGHLIAVVSGPGLRLQRRFFHQ